MQSELSETPNQDAHTRIAHLLQPTAAQHGSSRSRSSLPDARSPSRAQSTSPDVPGSGRVASAGNLDVGQLDETLGRLSVAEGKSAAGARATVAGQRITEYENAALASSPRHISRPTLGFKVTNGFPSGGVQLTDFPNEILTQILSHLHPDSHGAVALVSKRFYDLVTTPYAWRAAFLRYFPGQDPLSVNGKTGHQARTAESSDIIRSEVRYFTRLTALASWRSEYLGRTRLLRSVARGKPGTIGSSIRSSQSSKKNSAVLTYNSKLPWMISHVHADFTGRKKGPKVIHGTRDLGIATISDPTTGRIDKLGLDDPFSFQQLDEVYPSLEFFGVGEGPAAVPNVMDVSQPYGFVGGEGFPGGRVYYKATGQLRGHYLGQDQGLVGAAPEIPKIPELADAISSIWIAKSSNVPSMTDSMVGIMAGSTLGVVTCYALGHESTGRRYAAGDMTARWVLSPGVPIIDIKVDDQYNLRRKTLGRIWAVALNALGEVYYLTQVPSPPLHKGKAEDVVKDAWNAGRTAYWQLIDSTRRTARPDVSGKDAADGAYSPRSSPHSMDLSREQLAAEAREIEQYFRHAPSHFRQVCLGWDMLRRLEVDFTAGGENGGGEAIFVITCSNGEGEIPSLRRFLKVCSVTERSSPSGALTPVAPRTAPQTSIFGGEGNIESSKSALLQVGSNGLSALQELGYGHPQGRVNTEEWRSTEFICKLGLSAQITASAVDMSTFAVTAAFEDPLLLGTPASGGNSPCTPTSKHATGEIPGRRARLLAIGTNTGSIIVWNMRDTASDFVLPLRVIQTESPEITSLALSALYIVHGGSDSLVQAWDPLASALEPIRTLNAKSSGRIPRHILNQNPALQHANYFSVRAIFLDPDPTVLRGILAFGTFVRFWSYSSANHAPGRKRRLRHSDIHGRLASRRHNGTVSSYIAAEEAELRHEQEHRAREVERLRKRFGLGLGELTEEEAIQYAQMISEEAFLQDEQRRLGGASDAGDTCSSSCSAADTLTPEPSFSGSAASTAAGPSGAGLSVLREGNQGLADDDDDFEAQIQRAIRLSLLESVGDEGQSPSTTGGEGRSSYDYELHQGEMVRKGKTRLTSVSPVSSGVAWFHDRPAEYPVDAGGIANEMDVDDDLALALRLSLEEEEARKRKEKKREVAALIAGGEEFPHLEVKGKGKGNGV
ncbi:hypothetical protein C8A03DRAFT_34274 [Achaetomium macrosporum]|uniref:F-box domain-containing protein n=1 Tax=Achaetomium macrosporum TaxID=79813 RepID=A0AAN7C9G9_9PEZI|nr:hypothetical protein C8A03DRAFT_34274 [Achaetomium macrosporum]